MRQSRNIDYDGEQWVLLTAMRASKRTLQKHSLGELLDAMTQELDNQGRHRFKVYKKSEGQSRNVWVCCPLQR